MHRSPQKTKPKKESLQAALLNTSELQLQYRESLSVKTVW